MRLMLLHYPGPRVQKLMAEEVQFKLMEEASQLLWSGLIAGHRVLVSGEDRLREGMVLPSQL